MDADELDPDDLSPEDRAAGHSDSLHSDQDVEELLERHYAGIPSDDVDLPPTRRERR
jgi:multicomponent Na+:H+ antiporter subunit C